MKNFDCIAFKREAQERIYNETRGLSADEEVAYYHKAVQSGTFADLWRRLGEKKVARRASAGSARARAIPNQRRRG